MYLLDEAEYDMENYADLGGCYPPQPSASADNTLRNLHNSSYHTKAEFNNCFIIHSKYFQSSKTIQNVKTRSRIGFQSEYANFRVHGKIARYLKTMNKEQENNDQQVFGDENFIQGSDKFAFRSNIL